MIKVLINMIDPFQNRFQYFEVAKDLLTH